MAVNVLISAYQVVLVPVVYCDSGTCICFLERVVREKKKCETLLY